MECCDPLLHNLFLSKQKLNSVYITKDKVYLVFELCDYIHIAAGQLEVQKKLENDSQNQYHSSQSDCL